MPRAARTVFFDGLCQLCSREIAVIRRLARGVPLYYVDIADPRFDAAAHGVDAADVHRHMHVRDESTGRMLVGVDALVGLWECVPGFRWLALFARLPVLRQLADVGYEVFAWVRPRFPRRAACERCAT